MAHVKVEGTVDKPLGDKGFILLETIKLNDGRTFDKKWKVWATPIPDLPPNILEELKAKKSAQLMSVYAQGIQPTPDELRDAAQAMKDEAMRELKAESRKRVDRMADKMEELKLN